MLEQDTRAALVAWLEWQAAMGADAAIDDVPTDWLTRGAEPPGHDFDAGQAAADLPLPAAVSSVPPEPARMAPAAAQSRPSPAAAVRSPAATTPTGQRSTPAASPPARQFPTAAPTDAEASARRLARSAKSLDELQGLLAGFDGCALKATAKNLCFYRGAAQADLMIIGEAPGRDEDLAGQPFVGPAGKLLDKILAAAGFADGDCHITNVVYWRPPGNRTPTPQEVQVCRPFLERQIELVAPRVVLLTGGAAAKAVLDVAEAIMRLRGKWHDVTFGSHRVRAMATLHTAYLLRTPVAKRLAWRDMLTVKAALAGRV